MRTKQKTSARWRKLEAGRGAIAKALAQLEANEVALQAAREELRAAQKQLQPILVDMERYPHVMRALNTIAYADCEVDGVPCADRQAPFEDWCWPCYARHVVEGGMP